MPGLDLPLIQFIGILLASNCCTYLVCSDQYGLVEDVRIPCQQKRMFGFVTFYNIETVNLILSQDNEHLICGARVLVKPYREKSKLDRLILCLFSPTRLA